MALNKLKLKQDIIAVMTTMLTKEINSIEEFATALSDAFEDFVKSGTVNSEVTTAGSATAQTGTGVGTIS